VILADTSAWVEYDRASESAVDQRMIQLMALEEPQLSVTEPVMMEVLAGARSDQRERDLRRLMQRFPVLLFDPASDFDAAARIYRRCRAGGITPRGMVDCMIAAVAWRHEASLLAQDVDLVRVCRVIGVTMDQASVRI
jgi:predicted nucleic acid-binding protein